jgi:hypothetical protein
VVASQHLIFIKIKLAGSLETKIKADHNPHTQRRLSFPHVFNGNPVLLIDTRLLHSGMTIKGMAVADLIILFITNNQHFFIRSIRG